MAMEYSSERTFGLLPESEGRALPFVISSTVNLAILATALLVGMMAKHVIEQHYEMTELIVPQNPPPEVKIKQPPPPPQVKLPDPPKIQLQEKQIEMPKPKPEPKPVQMEAKVVLPQVQPKQQAVVMQPQPKAAMPDAMPAQDKSVKPSTAPVHLGQTFGVTPNPNATRPATVAAIGNPYGGMQGPAVAPHGVVGSTGMGTNTKSTNGYNYGGKVNSAGIPGATGTGTTGTYGKVASAAMPAPTQVAVVPKQEAQQVATDLEVLSKPPVRYTNEARQMRIEGDVVLRVTFLATGQVVVHEVVHGLGHGLDEEARRVAEQIRFRPATRDGKPVDLTTTIHITFQLA